MKNRFIAICMFLLLICQLLPAQVTAADSVVLQNGSFEAWQNDSTPYGWSFSGGTHAVNKTAGYVTDGIYSLYLSSGMGQEAKVSQDIEGLTPNAKYEVAVDFRLEEALGDNYGFSVKVGSQEPTARISNDGGKFLRLHCFFKAGYNGKATVTLLFKPSRASGIYIDGVTLQKTEKGTIGFYKSPVGHVLPGSVTSETDAALGNFRTGAYMLSEVGAVPAGGCFMRIEWPNGAQNGDVAILGAYDKETTTEGKKMLLGFSMVVRNDTSADAVFYKGEGQYRAFVWEGATLRCKAEAADLMKEETYPGIANGDFESYIGTTTTASAWTEKGSSNAYKKGNLALTSEVAHQSTKSLKVTADSTLSDIWAYQWVQVSGSSKYSLDLMHYAKVATSSGSVKIEQYDASGRGTGGDLPRNIPATTGTWSSLSIPFETNADTSKIMILLRVRGSGTIYFDDLKLTRLSSPASGTLETDSFFYYDEWEEGTATAHANVTDHPDLVGGSVRFTLAQDSGAPLSYVADIGANGLVTWDFPTSGMKTYGRGYTLSATLYDALGNIKEPVLKEMVYHFDRPSALDGNGNYRNDDGSIFIPKIAYHVDTVLPFTPESEMRKQLQYCKDVGINTVQMSTGQMLYPEYMTQTLDIIASMDMRALVTLYASRQNDMAAAGSAENIELTKQIVNTVKNHKAVFAYAVFDEPAIGRYGLTEEDLVNSYLAIRNIDKKHPTFVVIAPTKGGYADIGLSALTKYTDVVCYDPYPGTNNDAPTTYVYDVHSRANVLRNKPAYTLLQTFDYNGYFPTAEEYRHMWYQAAMGGSKGIGYYSHKDAIFDKDGNVIGLWNSDIWDEMVTFADKEMIEAEKYFYLGQYQMFSSGNETKYMYESWKVGNDIYMVVLDKSATPAQTRPSIEPSAISVSIPLVSADGKTTVGAFKAVELYGGTGKTVSGRGALQISLGWRDAVVYKITPQ